MMKKLSFFFVALFACIVSANAAPKLLKVQGGNVRLNFNRDNQYLMIDAYWNNRPMLTGVSGQMLCYAEAKNGFVGAGRKHGAHVEKLESFTVKIDGNPVDITTADSFSGTVAECERVTMVRDIKLVYKIRLEGDRMMEEVSFTPSVDLKLQSFYNLHQWNKRFVDYRTINNKGVATAMTLSRAKKIIYHGYSVISALADPEGEDAAVIQYQRGDKIPPTCYLQDKWNGAEDALIICTMQKIAANTTFSYQSVITFVRTGSAEGALEKVK